MALDYGQGNCQSDYRGSGLTSCNISDFGDVSGMLLVKRGLDLSTVLDTEENYRTAIEEGNIYPYLNIYNFEQNTPDNETSTSGRGTMSTIRTGKPQFNFQFTSGSCLHKALFDKRGNNAWDMVIVFETGILLNQTTEKGFKTSMLDVQTFRLLQGTDPQSSTAMVQLANATEFNVDHGFVTWDKLGYNVNNINGAINVTLNVVSSSATEVVVQAVSSCNTDLSLSYLDELANWSSAKSDGTVQTITAVTESSNGNYTIEGTFDVLDTIIYLKGTDILGEIHKGVVRIS